jgi:hypothetical protein
MFEQKKDSAPRSMGASTRATSEPERGMALNDALRYYDEMVRSALGVSG